MKKIINKIKITLPDDEQIFRVHRCSTSWRGLHIEYYREKNSTERKRDADVPLDSLQVRGRKVSEARGGEETERGSRNYPYISWSLQDSYRSGRRRFPRFHPNWRKSADPHRVCSPLKFRIREFAIHRNVVTIHNLELNLMHSHTVKFVASIFNHFLDHHCSYFNMSLI